MQDFDCRWMRIVFQAKLGLLLGFLSAAGCLSEFEKPVSPRRANQMQDAHQATQILVALDDFKCYADCVRSTMVKTQIQDQARAVLLSHLQNTKKFRIQERSIDVTKRVISGTSTGNQKHPKYLVSGEILEFGRKETSDWLLWGILSASKKQVAYAKINLNILDTSTLEVVHSVQGEGQFHFSQNGYVAASFSGASTFDWVVSGKVIDLAIVEAVNRLTADIANQNCRL